MNAKMKATFAMAIVAMMVFTAAGATTYSWFSDTEETDVTISTAKVDISGVYAIDSITVGNNKISIVGNDDDNEDTITLGEWNSRGDGNIISLPSNENPNKIGISKAIPSKIAVSYTVTNESSINAYWRMYTALPNDVSIVGKTPTNGITYLAGNETGSEVLTAEGVNKTKTIEFVIDLTNIKKTGDDATSPVEYTFTFVSEAYQFGYNYSAPVSMVAGTATIPNVVGKNVKVEGITHAAEGVTSVPIVMEFDQSTNEKIANATLSVESIKDASGNFKIGSDEANAVVLDINLNNGAVSDLGGYVSITVPIKGDVDDPQVFYTKNGADPVAMDVIGNSYDNGYTYVTFKTNHFSEYVVGDFEALVDDTYFSTLEEAADNSNGKGVTLLKDATLEEDISLGGILTINSPLTLDGGGKTITSSAGRAINVDVNGSVTIKNVTIVANGERAINVIQKPVKLIIDNVDATSTNYTINISTSAGAANVDIDRCTLSGLCVVNNAGPGAKITVDNSIINCNDKNETVGESYAALSLNKDAVNGSIVANKCTINVMEGSDSAKARNGADGGLVTVDGSTEGVLVIVAAIEYDGSPYYHGFSFKSFFR